MSGLRIVNGNNYKGRISNIFLRMATTIDLLDILEIFALTMISLYFGKYNGLKCNNIGLLINCSKTQHVKIYFYCLKCFICIKIS